MPDGAPRAAPREEPAMATCRIPLKRTLPVVALGLALASPLHAQRLGAEGNVGVRNPYPLPGNENFGRQVASGDFDGDGVDDLVIGGGQNARMRILLGNAWTIGAAFPIKFTSSIVETPPYNGAIAVGDFDGDGRDEIALGNPSYSQSGLPSQGSVAIMDRATNGTWSTQETIRLGASGYAGTPGEQDGLGRAMASGDFDDDGYADLAIGAPGKLVSGAQGAGAVLIAYGSATGLVSARSELFTRSNDGLAEGPEVDDTFGGTLASADFTNDGPDDLAIGIRRARCPNDTLGGAVVVLRGQAGSGGLTSTQSRILFAGVDGVPGTCIDGRSFGESLATGIFNADVRPDLVVGSPGSSPERGSVTVLPSGVTGPDGPGALLIRGIDLPIPMATSNARFGRVLTVGRVRGTSSLLESLVIGAPFDDAEGQSQAGSVWVVHPATDGSGLSLAGAERWTLRTPLAAAPAGINDQAGSAIAVGDFNDDNAGDLAIGAYLSDELAVDAGVVQVIYQSGFLFRDGFD